MTAITEYVSYSEVRATLGLSSTELSDTVLSLQLYADQAELALEDVDSGLVALYASTKALGTHTADQSKFLRVTRLFVAYKLAQVLCTSLPLFSVKSLKDGKAEFTRNEVVYNEMLESINTMLEDLKMRLHYAYALVQAGYTATTRGSFRLTAAAVPATDPVTGA